MTVVKKYIILEYEIVQLHKWALVGTNGENVSFLGESREGSHENIANFVECA